MARREFLQLAKTFNPEKSNIAGWFLSEKLDGTRCFWDGGLSRGLPTVEVPWASVTDPKTGGRKAKIKPTATGLWSRYGNPIIAPDWFLDDLPPCFLDGELWAGRGRFQTCRSICAGDSPDPRFDQITYGVYSSPHPERLFADGEIKNTNFHCAVSYKEFMSWARRRIAVRPGFDLVERGSTFAGELKFLQQCVHGEFVRVHEQIMLPHTEVGARQALESFLDEVLSHGGEGVIVRSPTATWTPKRVSTLLKYKPFLDAEATITGFTSGRKTDKGSKHLGKIGALITDFRGKRLELSGLTDAEREFTTDAMKLHATRHPGVDMPSEFQGKHFRVGETVSFRFRELTDSGVPKEARYFRKRDIE